MDKMKLNILTKMGRIHSELISVKGSGWMPLPVLIYKDGTAKTLTTESPELAGLELRKTLGPETCVEVHTIPAMPELLLLESQLAEEVNYVATEMLGCTCFGNVAVMPKDMLQIR